MSENTKIKIPVTFKFITIGVYGFSEEEFFQALEDAGVEVFFDIRWRRGVRGAEYAFANHKRLEGRLASMGIRYIHRHDLAPPPGIRQVQYQVDANEKVSKRQRTSLSPEFASAYLEQILNQFDLESILEEVPEGTSTAALFCVEKYPHACHRSLVAEKLNREFGIEIEHILPA